MTPIHIRRLNADDAPAFRQLRLKGLAEHPDFYTSTVEDWDKPLEAFAERIAIAPIIGAFAPEGTLLGFALLATHHGQGAKLRHKCEIWSVYVLPERRGEGIARQILEAVIELARSLGYDWLKLGVAEHNLRARQLYESLGFVSFSREEDHLRLPDGRSITELMMQKRL
ncbi:MAG: GNAT family N-acetyltransferase [Methylobacterium sp.]|nr:GNAT family N-acetyltransferase [Methylobacterium sp.]MCA3606447.1 GNAT family N-acetyltransferase [Methylobacterium sp.]MCA3610414.1 GNAT family N-acetyltransferase [Methylobacterium sp.]MCA3617696.1 GNAT family N-acetyltransferase [Methylobacterium sp.]MCA3619565.1 GNAT family N-acetyltransferase [Methylobacterium sp.]